MDFALSPQHEDIRRTVRDFAERRIVPIAEELERKGEFPMVTPPAGIGMEAAGTVVGVGTGVHHLLPGDLVAYAHEVPGAYATLRTLPADRVVLVPAGIDAETAAAALFKGMTAEYLLHRTHQLRAGDRVLVHAAAGGVGEAVRKARAAAPALPLEVECRTLEEVDEALAAGAPRILLDNMTPAELRAAVAHVGGKAELEASGGVTLEGLREIAETGVDFISVGALTHSAPTLDLSLILRPIP